MHVDEPRSQTTATVSIDPPSHDRARGRRLSIRSKIVLTCLSPLVISVSAGLVWSGRTAEHNLIQARQDAARIQAANLALSIGIGLEAVAATMELVRADTDVMFVVVRAADGATVAHYRKETRTGGEADGSLLKVVAPVNFSDSTTGSLELGLSIARLREGSEQRAIVR